MKRLLSITLLIPLLLGFAVQGLTQESVEITIRERAGVDRINEFASFGVPLPREWNVTDVSSLRLKNADNTPIPAQFEALARWGSHVQDPSAPVKWAFVGFCASISGGASTTLQLDHQGPGPIPPTAIQIDNSTPGKWFIDSGAAQFELNTDAGFNLFHQVTVAGHPTSPT